MNNLQSIAVENQSQANDSYIDWAFYNWGNPGPLEPLKATVSVDLESKEISIIPEALDEHGNEIDLPCGYKQWVREKTCQLVGELTDRGCSMTARAKEFA